MVVLGLGSNCGNRMEHLRKALQHLELQILATSPIYESDALLPEGAPQSWNQPYLNLNVLCKTHLAPPELLRHVQAVEKKLGRQDRKKWAPRQIDIDILAMDLLHFESPELTIPHPGLLERPFALLPLVDLLPYWKWPKAGPQFGMELFKLVSQWRHRAIEQVPFRTRRSQYCLTEYMGILNLTPDSFSDGGMYQDPAHSLNHALKLFHQGASVLDLGAESTRPGAVPVPPEKEWARLEPTLKSLQLEFSKLDSPPQISIDTRHAEVASKAIQAGANWINDVMGFENPRMQEAVADFPVDLVVMHSLSIPPSWSSVLSDDSDPIAQLLEWGSERIAKLAQNGIARDRIIFDPGIGFGKTASQSWEILRRAQELHSLGVRILIGHSRKSFFSHRSEGNPVPTFSHPGLQSGSSITQQSFVDRDLETLVISLDLAAKGIQFIRIHNMEIHQRAMKAWTQTHGIAQCSH